MGLLRKKSPNTDESAHTSVVAEDVPVAKGVLVDTYVRQLPCAQNTLDLFEDRWISSLPPRLGLRAGSLPTFNDTRIAAVLKHLDSIKGFKVLELGPMEGGHTYMLHEAGASIVSIEASSRSFLKCLVVKELLNLNRAHLHLGDFVPYLETTNDRFDLVVASGVLYHVSDPIHMLERLSTMSDTLAIWSHYFQADAIAADPAIAPLFPSTDTIEWRGHSITSHTREYPEALDWTGFSGGPATSAAWLERDDILSVLAELGYGNVTVLEDNPDQANGPAILLVAQR